MSDDYLEVNRALWDEWTAIHESSAFYDVEGFKRGGVRLRDFELEEVGDVQGKSLLHIQCHFGIDTLSWARLGATVTGVDFSEPAIVLARRLADEVGLEARFLRSNVYHVDEVLDEEEFDVVYTSRGVLGWLPDVPRWAEVVARYVRPGGFFYIHEMHPFLYVFDDSEEATDLRVRFPYFPREEPLVFPVKGSYAEPEARVGTPHFYDWPHSMGEIVTALIENGLRVEFLHEFPFLDWSLPFLEKRGRYWWLPEEREGEIPLMFSLKASKPG
jgi:SAM-dependent methyltransferase